MSAQKNVIIMGIIGLVAAIAVGYYTNPVAAIAILIAAGVSIVVYLKKLYTVVEANKINVVSGGGKIKPYKDGDTYTFLPLFQKRDIVTRSVIEIGVPKIKLLDTDTLPFAV